MIPRRETESKEIASSSSTSPYTLIIIGPQGSGKTTLMHEIAKLINGIPYDGDDAMPKDSVMRRRVENGDRVYLWHVHDFIKNHLTPTLVAKKREAAAQNKPLVVSQGLFFNRHRHLIQQALEGQVAFIFLDITPELQAKQVAARCATLGKTEERTQREIKSAISDAYYLQEPDEALKPFSRKISYRGKGHEKEFLDEFLAWHKSYVLPKMPESVPTKINPYWIATGIVLSIATVGAILYAAQKGDAGEAASLTKAMNTTGFF